MSPKLNCFVITIALLMSGLSAFAQSDSHTPPAPGTRAPSFPGLVVPIDENIVILVVLGLIVGLFYYRKTRKAVV